MNPVHHLQCILGIHLKQAQDGTAVVVSISRERTDDLSAGFDEHVLADECLPVLPTELDRRPEHGQGGGIK